jgi:uncharacterized protein
LPIIPRVRPLTAVEIRVLGALLEKEQTTPNAYPLTVNALLSACNQKTNREPVTDLSEGEVWDALESLRRDVLVWRSEGARVERWEHRLDRRWRLTPARKAVMTLLLLRGPQTPGELRTRSDRMHRFDDVGEVEDTLRDLATAPDPHSEEDEDHPGVLVTELERRPGQRENRWAQTVGEDDPVETEAREVAAAPAGENRRIPAGPPPRATADPELAGRVEALERTVESLRQDLAELRRALGA